MSARLDAVRATERKTLPIPFGHRVYVVSDLSLSPTSNEASRPLREFIELLEDIDDPAVVVVAGNLFHPSSTSDLAKLVDATLAVLPGLARAISSFTQAPGHRFIVLPGSDDIELRDNVVAQDMLAALGVTLARDLVLQIATADGVRDLAVAPGTCDVDVSRADRGDRADADRLEDPPALSRFVASRTLYRRLGVWVWFPVLAMAGFDLFNSLTRIANHFTHHHFDEHAPHTHSFWGNLVLNLVFIGSRRSWPDAPGSSFADASTARRETPARER